MGRVNQYPNPIKHNTDKTQRWNGTVVVLMPFSLMAAPEGVHAYFLKCIASHVTSIFLSPGAPCPWELSSTVPIVKGRLPHYPPPEITVNTLRPRQNGRHCSDDIFECIFLNENVWNLLKTSMKFVSRVPINNIPALDQIMAWCRLGDKPLFGPMMVR